jgi:hypothetical protein
MALVWMALPANAEERIDFDGIAIEGRTTGPAGAHIGARSAQSFDALIEERSSFREEMASELQDIDENEPEAAPPPRVRVAQAGTVDPCHDELYLSLKNKDLESLSDREFETFKAKDQACNEARVRAVATPSPAPTPDAPVAQPTPDLRPVATPVATPAPAPAPSISRWRPSSAKDLLLLMFGGVALLLLMMGGMLLLLVVLAA